jgi:hypothetical protein
MAKGVLVWYGSSWVVRALLGVLEEIMNTCCLTTSAPLVFGSQHKGAQSGLRSADGSHTDPKILMSPFRGPPRMSPLEPW